MLTISTHPSSLVASRVLAGVQTNMQNAMARISSGLRINSAADDAAGLAIASRMEARGRAIDAGLRGLNDMVSLLQIADSTLASIAANLQRIRELAVQAVNGTYTATDRLALDQEAKMLMDASRQMQSNAVFNGQKILDGSLRFFDGQSNQEAGVTLDIQALFLAQTTDALFRYAQLAQATTSTTPAGALAAGDLLINGQPVPASAAGSQAGQSADSAWAVAAAINSAGITDLTATASTTTVTGGSVLPANGGLATAGEISINGIAIGAGNYVSAINAIAGQTGVTASVIAGTAPPGFPADVPFVLVLKATDGRNISVSGAGGFGLADQSAVATVTVKGPPAEGLAANLVIAGNNPGNAGLAAGPVAGVATGEQAFVALDEQAGFDQNPNLQTSEAARATILIMDRKLNKLLTIRARLGAVQNTLEMRASFLALAGETNAAARARIVDADYAIEVATLTRANIIQSAGLAMIAQSNASRDLVLSLLTRPL